METGREEGGDREGEEGGGRERKEEGGRGRRREGGGREGERKGEEGRGRQSIKEAITRGVCVCVMGSCECEGGRV